MKTSRTKRTHTKPIPESSRLARPGIWAGILLLFLGYLLLFLYQPSLLGQVNQQGEPTNRLVDLMLLPVYVSLILGDGSQPAVIFDRLPIFFAVASWLGIAFWIGRPCVAWACRSTAPADQAPNRLEFFSLATLLGLALLSTITLLVGLAGGLHNRIPLFVSVALAVAGSAALQWRHAACRPATESPNEPPDTGSTDDQAPAASLITIRLQRLIPVATCVLVAIYLLSSVLPSTDFDVLEYHLQAPKEFHAAGAIHFLDHNIYANMPLGCEMHTLAAMTILGGDGGWWWGGLIGKCIIACHTLLAAGLLGGFIARKTTRFTGWSAAGLLLATPGSLLISTSGLIDMGLAAYTLAVCWMLLKICQLETPAATDSLKSGRWLHFGPLLLLFMFAGAAAACKYPGVIFCVLPAGITAGILAVRKNAPFTARSAAVAACLGLLITCSSWYLKNAAQTGNPVYPLLPSVFGGVDPEHAEQWRLAHRPGGPAGNAPFSLAEAAASAKSIFVGSKFNSPSILFLAVIGFVATWRKLSPGSLRKLAIVSASLLIWIWLVWWFATHRIDRFWLPALPLQILLAAVAIHTLITRVSAGLATGIVATGVAYGTILALSTGGLFVPISHFRAELRDVDNTGRVSQPIAWCNKNLSDSSAHLLLIGEAKAFSFEPQITYATCFNATPGQNWLENKSPDTQRENLLAAGITHIVINWGEIARYRRPSSYGFTDWPQTSDCDAWIASGVARRVSTPFRQSDFEVLEVLLGPKQDVASEEGVQP